MLMRLLDCGAGGKKKDEEITAQKREMVDKLIKTHLNYQGMGWQYCGDIEKQEGHRRVSGP